MAHIDLEPLWLTLKLAVVTTAVLFIISIPLSYWLSQKKNYFKTIIETIVSMPLILPPSVIGFYLLLAFSPSSVLGNFLERHFDIRLVFSFPGLVIASVVYSLPFMVHPLQSGFSALSPTLAEASFSLGKTKFQTLIKVLLPNIKGSVLAAVVLTFAHTIGEFGVVLMIGGNIPGETKVASIAIFDEVEAMDYGSANSYALILFITSFIILMAVYLSKRRFDKLKLL